MQVRDLAKDSDNVQSLLDIGFIIAINLGLNTLVFLTIRCKGLNSERIQYLDT